ncbi:MAG: DNA internalization-related competence protein ComEC/Rec2 [Myxococcota bacterium]
MLSADWLEPPAWALLSGAAVLLALDAMSRRRRSPPRPLLCAAIFLAGAGALAWRLEAADRNRPLGVLRAVLEGSVASVARTPDRVRVVLSSVYNPDPRGPRLPSRLQLVARASELESVQPGERLRLRARLRSPRERRNPGTRPRLDRLRRAGIGAEATPVEPVLAVRLPEREGLQLLAPIRRLRARAARRLQEEGRGGALLAALALGERGQLSREARAAFAGLGLAHLLAVSGLHLALVAAGVHALSRGVLARVPRLAARLDVRKPALLVVVASAVAQALLAGWGIPVRRALILLLATAAGVARGRPGRRFHPLGLAALLVLAREPAALFEAGAQLSFAACAALVWAVEREPQRRGGWWTRARRTLHTTATAGAVTTPLVAWHLGMVAPLGLVTNLLALPWVGVLLLPAALLCALLATCEGAWIRWPLAAGVLLGELSLRAVDAAVAWIPTPALRVDPAPGWLLLGAGGVLVSLCARATRWRITGWAFAAVLCVAAPPRALEPPPPRLVILDVGHGDAVVVQGRTAAVLVDAGVALPDGLDLGRYTVVPALAALGIEALDLVVATHADLDHRGGLPAVLQSIPVAELWLPAGGRQDPDFALLRIVARARGVPVRERGAGDPVKVAGDLRIEPLWPPRGRRPSSRNDGSLVVRVAVTGSRILLAGDVEAAAEAALARSAELSAEVLLLPHHGSRSSSSAAFLDAVRPRLVVASASCTGRFATPHPEVRDRLQERGLPLWWTGRDGAVLVGLGERLAARGFGTSQECASDPGISHRRGTLAPQEDRHAAAPRRDPRRGSGALRRRSGGGHAPRRSRCRRRQGGASAQG